MDGKVSVSLFSNFVWIDDSFGFGWRWRWEICCISAFDVEFYVTVFGYLVKFVLDLLGGRNVRHLYLSGSVENPKGVLGMLLDGQIINCF